MGTNFRRRWRWQRPSTLFDIGSAPCERTRLISSAEDGHGRKAVFARHEVFGAESSAECAGSALHPSTHRFFFPEANSIAAPKISRKFSHSSYIGYKVPREDYSSEKQKGRDDPLKSCMNETTRETITIPITLPSAS